MQELKKLVSGSILNRSQTQQEDIYLTRQETARRLSISLPTLNSYSKRGFIKSYNIGNRILYKESEVEAALTEVKTVKY
ncbi:helix-turn-helix domain-containing protein [Echinicola sediminis]